MNEPHELITLNEGLPFKIFLFEGKDGGYHRERHWHRSVELFAVCEGELGFAVESRGWQLTRGHFVVVNSNEVHAIDAPYPNETIVIQIPLGLFEQYFTGEQFIWFTHDPGKEDAHFMELVRDIWQVYCAGGLGSELRVKSLFYQILYLLVTEYRLPEVERDKVQRNRKRERLSVVTSYMEKNYAGELSLAAVAERFGYSPNYLSRMFQKYAGITFRDHLQNVRLEHALGELADERYSLSEVAARNGFSDSRALARALRRKYGILPSEYRRRIRNIHNPAIKSVENDKEKR